MITGLSSHQNDHDSESGTGTEPATTKQLSSK